MWIRYRWALGVGLSEVLGSYKGNGARGHARSFVRDGDVQLHSTRTLGVGQTPWSPATWRAFASSSATDGIPLFLFSSFNHLSPCITQESIDKVPTHKIPSAKGSQLSGCNLEHVSSFSIFVSLIGLASQLRDRGAYDQIAAWWAGPLAVPPSPFLGCASVLQSCNAIASQWEKTLFLGLFPLSKSYKETYILKPYYLNFEFE